jgi:hypothetical protein
LRTSHRQTRDNCLDQKIAIVGSSRYVVDVVDVVDVVVGAVVAVVRRHQQRSMCLCWPSCSPELLHLVRAMGHQTLSFFDLVMVTVVMVVRRLSNL